MILRGGDAAAQCHRQAQIGHDHFRRGDARQGHHVGQAAQVADAEHLARDIAKARSPWFSYAGMALQLAIVLSSAAILAVMMPLLYASVVVGLGGAVLLLNALVM